MKPAMKHDGKNTVRTSLLDAPLQAIGVDLEGFAGDLRAHRVPVIQVDRSPPRVPGPRLAALLSKLSDGGESP